MPSSRLTTQERPRGSGMQKVEIVCSKKETARDQGLRATVIVSASSHASRPTSSIHVCAAGSAEQESRGIRRFALTYHGLICPSRTAVLEDVGGERPFSTAVEQLQRPIRIWHRLAADQLCEGAGHRGRAGLGGAHEPESGWAGAPCSARRPVQALARVVARFVERTCLEHRVRQHERSDGDAGHAEQQPSTHEPRTAPAVQLRWAAGELPLPLVLQLDPGGSGGHCLRPPPRAGGLRCCHCAACCSRAAEDGGGGAAAWRGADGFVECRISK